MKANELMIGDWVFEGKDHPVKVGSNYGRSIMYKDEYSKEVEETCLNPIPLTEDILKANGWNIGCYSILNIDERKFLEYYHYEKRFRMWWQGVDEWQNHSYIKEIIMQCHCTYVHELQHALRLCGLVELADNFKLPKQK